VPWNGKLVERKLDSGLGRILFALCLWCAGYGYGSRSEGDHCLHAASETSGSRGEDMNSQGRACMTLKAQEDLRIIGGDGDLGDLAWPKLKV